MGHPTDGDGSPSVFRNFVPCFDMKDATMESPRFPSDGNHSPNQEAFPESDVTPGDFVVATFECVSDPPADSSDVPTEHDESDANANSVAGTVVQCFILIGVIR